eukprot:EST43855.1 Myb-like DNA-binding domain-containing protein [Spironucleus salmonicida]
MTIIRSYTRWGAADVRDLLQLVARQLDGGPRRLSWIEVGAALGKTPRQCYDYWVQHGRAQARPTRGKQESAQQLQEDPFQSTAFDSCAFWGLLE